MQDFKDVRDPEICEAFDQVASDLQALDKQGRVYLVDAADAVFNHMGGRGVRVLTGTLREAFDRIENVLREAYNAKGREYIVLG